jgi:hypothetical protein
MDLKSAPKTLGSRFESGRGHQDEKARASQNDAPKSDGILFENALEAFSSIEVPLHTELIQRAEADDQNQGRELNDRDEA